MRRVALLLLTAILAGPADGQTKSGQTVSAPTASALACGVLKAESSRDSSTSQWTISAPSRKTTETGVLRSGPRSECIEGAILVIESTSTAGHSFFDAYFHDGPDIR